MKNIKTFESYNNSESYGMSISKDYGDEFPMSEVKVGTEIIYMGSPYTVESNDGFVLVAKSKKTGGTTKINQNMFNQRVLIK